MTVFLICNNRKHLVTIELGDIKPIIIDYEFVVDVFKKTHIIYIVRMHLVFFNCAACIFSF